MVLPNHAMQTVHGLTNQLTIDMSLLYIWIERKVSQQVLGFPLLNQDRNRFGETLVQHTGDSKQQDR